MLRKLLIPFLILAVSLGVLLALVKSPLASVFYANALAHSFTLLAITAVLFFVWFFSYQNYAKEKDIRWHIMSLSFYALGAFGFIHAVLVPAFGWGNETLFDIFEHYGMFLASFLLWGLIIPFSGKIQERIYRARTKIFLGTTFLLLVGFSLLFFLPPIADALFRSVNIFIGLTATSFFLLFLVLCTRKEDSFFTSSFPNVLALLTATAAMPLFYQEWNAVWWYYHLLWLVSVLLLLLLLLRAKKGKNIIEILFSSFSIRTRLFFIVGLTLTAIVINGLIDFRLSQNHLQVQTLENLVLLADMQEGQVLNYLDKLKDRVIDFSSDGFIRENLKKILAGDKEAVNDLNRHLLENKQPLDPAIFGIHIMDSNGKVVAASQGSEVGAEDMALEEIFIQASGARYAGAYVSDIMETSHFSERNIALMATAPIINQTREENMGVIMLFFKAQVLSDILRGRTQTQSGALSTWANRTKTMEMYLVNQDQVMISESRFIINAPLKQKVDTVPVRLCAKSEEMSGEYLDYRGIPVFGASMCFANGWTLLVEIDKSEALATLSDYLQQNLLSGSATFLLILIVMYLFIIGITSPLKALSEAAQKIGRGDFTTRSTLITRDEFGQLSQTFNEMAENIQKSSADLQQKVKEEETSRLAMSNILGDLEVAKTELEQAKAKDEAILGSIGDAVMACDKDGRVMLFNGVAQELTGFSLKEVIGRHYGQLLKFIKESDGKPGNDFISEAIKAGQQTKMANHTLLITKDGQKIPVADSAAPVKNAQGEIIGCVVVFRDVTHERDIDKAKTEFVSLASHQLRTPLTAIRWYLEDLKSGETGKLNPEQLEDINITLGSTKRMIKLVNDLLNVARLESGRLTIEPQPTDLTNLIKAVLAEQAVTARTRNCTLEFLAPKISLPEIKIDPELISQVVNNLVSNAIKYGYRKRGKAKVLVALAKGVKELIIKVEDNGLGILPKDQSRVFSKFFRADNAVKKVTEGSGLGLYIAKLIIEASGGKIWFESQANQGSTFYFTLPLVGSRERSGEIKFSTG